jgi:DNA-binding response OmpR family regulator
MSISLAFAETAERALQCLTACVRLQAAGVGELGPEAGRLEDMRILIAEDEFFVGIQLEEDLRSAGCSILGPFRTLEMATQASRRERFDLAILDINLNGNMVYPLADELSARGVPLIFLSGYISANLPERFRRSPQIAKPHDPAALLKKIRTVVAKAN